MVARWKVVASFLLAETFLLASITQLRGCLADPVLSPAYGVDLSGSYPSPSVPDAGHVDWTTDITAPINYLMTQQSPGPLQLEMAGEVVLTFAADGGVFARDGSAASDKEIARAIRQWAPAMAGWPKPYKSDLGPDRR